jgi:hypothetical protein
VGIGLHDGMYGFGQYEVDATGCGLPVCHYQGNDAESFIAFRRCESIRFFTS